MQVVDWKKKSVLFGTTGLLLWAGLTVFSRLGDAPVYIENEAREGVYVRAMLDTGNYVLPETPNHVENGEIVPDKPPLFHWAGAAATAARSFLTTGHGYDGRRLSREFDEWTLRFPSALFGILTVVAFLVLGPRLIGRRGAMLAAACLLTSWQFIHQSRYGRVDMALTCCVTWSVLFLGWALLESRKGPFMAAAVFSGLGVLAKGPLGLVLPGIIGTAWAIRETAQTRSLLWVRRFPWVRAALLWLLVAMPWYLAAYAMGGMAVVRSQLLHENFHQFTGANAHMALFYYLGPWLTDSLPWNLLALAGVWLAVKQHERGAKFCTLWWVAFMLFFTFSAYKRRAYILPALPASSMLAGYALDRLLPATANTTLSQLAPWLRTRWKALVLTLLGAAGLGVLALQWPLVQSLLAVDLPAKDGAITGVALVVFAGAAVGVVQSLRRRDVWAALLALWVTLTALYMGVVVTGETVTALRKSPKPLLHRILRDLPPDEKLTVCGLGDDPSMLLLLYFPDPARIAILPQRETPPTPFPPGYHLASREVWEQVEGHTGWREVWTGELRERSKRKPLVFAEKLQAGFSHVETPPM